MGLQIIAKKGDDIKLLSFAKTYEKIYNLGSWGCLMKLSLNYKEGLKDIPKDSDVIMPIQNFIDMKNKKTTFQQK